MNGNVIKDLRDKKNLSQREVAFGTGLTEATLFDIESGKANPTFSTLKKIADYHGVKVSQLIKED